MLDLQPGVHFQEEELPSGKQELHRAGRRIADAPRRGHGRFAHRGTQFVVHRGRWGFFDDLLVTPLDRAFPLEQMDQVAVLVAQYLDLHVACGGEPAFQEKRVVPERRPGFPLRSLHGRSQFAGGFHDPHAAARRRQRTP